MVTKHSEEYKDDSLAHYKNTKICTDPAAMINKNNNEMSIGNQDVAISCRNTKAFLISQNRQESKSNTNEIYEIIRMFYCKFFQMQIVKQWHNLKVVYIITLKGALKKLQAHSVSCK